MNTEHATKWIEALESGDYKQGTGMLCNRDQFCCLGVAAELMGCESTGATDGIRNYRFKDGGYSSTVIPEHVLAGWLGIAVSEAADMIHGNEHTPTSRGVFRSEGLMSANDGGKTFKQIARHLRSRFGISK